MEKKVHCVIQGELLPWEREYFTLLFESLRSHFLVEESQRPHPGGVTWVLAKDWRRAVKTAARAGNKGSVFVSVLANPVTEPWFGLSGFKTRLPSHVRLIAHSPFTRRVLSEMEGVSSSQIIQWPLPGLRGQQRVSLPGPFRVACLGAMDEEANLNYLVSVAHYVSRMSLPIQFIIGQQGELYPHFLSMTHDLGIESSFTPFEKMQGPIDALLHAPLKAEHFIPVFWAAAQGIPVIASSVAGIEEVIRDGHDGFVVPVNETRPVGELLARLAQNAAFALALGAELRERLAERFSLDVVAPQYCAVFFPQTHLVSDHEVAA